jgi:hypothetical protein
MTPTSARHVPPSLFHVGLLTATLILLPGSVSAQWDAPVQPHRAPLAIGTVVLDATLHFRFADRYLGNRPFSDLVTTDDASSLFDPGARLADALTTLGAASAPLSVGGVSASIQASQTRVPVTLRAGLPWGIELEATARFVRTRLEAETRLLPEAPGTLGRSPALDDASAVQTFVDDVIAATEGFSAGGRDWSAWGAAWRAAYRASVLFPTADSEAATQLLAELDSLNSALVADGRTPVSGSPLFAQGALTADDFGSLAGGAPYGLAAFSPTPYVFETGDVDVVLHYGLVGEARVPEGGDALPPTDGSGLRVSGGARIPLAAQSNPDLPFSTAAGDGVFATLAGADGWISSGPWSLSGTVRTVFSGSRDVVRRIGPVEQVFLGRDSRVGLSWTPGSRVFAHLRAGFRPAGPLRLELGYTLDRRGEDDYELVGSVPVLDGTTAFPTPALFTDPALLEAGTGGTVHWLLGGVRWVPRERGAFGVAFDVGAPVSGDLPRAYEWTELRLRVYRAIRLFD